MWPLCGHGREHTDSLAAVTGALRRGRGEMDVEVVRDEWEGAGMDGSGKFSRNPRCQILYSEVKWNKKLGGRTPPGPAGGA